MSLHFILSCKDHVYIKKKVRLVMEQHLNYGTTHIGEGNRNPLQCSFLENLMDKGAWQATVHGVTKSWTWLRDSHTHTTHIKTLAVLTSTLAPGISGILALWVFFFSFYSSSVFFLLPPPLSLFFFVLFGIFQIFLQQYNSRRVDSSMVMVGNVLRLRQRKCFGQSKL